MSCDSQIAERCQLVSDAQGTFLARWTVETLIGPVTLDRIMVDVEEGKGKLEYVNT